MKDKLAAGSGGVDRLLQAAEPNAAVGQAGDGVDQVPERPAEAVEFPDDQVMASSVSAATSRWIRSPEGA